MRHQMHNWRSFPAGLVMLLLLISGCTPPSQFQQTSTAALPSGTVTAFASTGLRGAVVALLADNRLLAVRPTDGRVIVEQTLGAVPPVLVGAGHYLAMSPDGKLLYVLPYVVAGTRSSVVVIATATASVQASYLLPASGIVYRSLAVGAKTGQIYLFGNRGSSVVITVLDAHTGAARISWTARPANGHNWLVYQGAVSSDERQLLVSYHGPDTTGVDVFTRQGQALQRCPSLPFSSVDVDFGCLRSHGGFTFYGAGILAATGTSLIEELDLQGGLHQAFDTRLVGHLMEFVVDAQRQRLYMLGACGYVSGFSAVDLGKGGVLATPDHGPDGQWRWQTPPAPPLVLTANNGVCGERLALTADGQLVTGKTAVTVPDPSLPGQLLFVDANTGRLLRFVATPSELLDVLAFPGP